MQCAYGMDLLVVTWSFSFYEGPTSVAVHLFLVVQPE